MLSRPLALALALAPFLLTYSLAQTPYVSLGAFSGPGKVCPRIISLIQEEGGNLDWGPKGWIAYDHFDSVNKRYQVSLLLPDGQSGGAITNYRGPMARTDVGNPTWTPDGQFLVVQADDAPTPDWAIEKPEFYRRISRPSVGYNNNLWLMANDGSKAYPLLNIKPGSGAVHPRLSHHGDRLLWSELVSLQPQKWVMRLAPFSLDVNGPHLGPITTLDPLKAPFYETSDFAPNDQSILFATTACANDYQHLALARLDLASGKVTFLTDPQALGHNEFARFSPNGSQIIWASSLNIPPRNDFPLLGSDYWIMNADGSAQRRLTYFNDPDAPEYRLSANIASSLSWSPDGKRFVANVHFRTPSDPSDDYISSILLISLPER